MKNPTWLLLLTLGLAWAASPSADVPTSTSSYLTVADRARFKKILEPEFKLKDLSNVYYAVLGLKHMKERVVKIGETCEFLINSAKDTSLTTEQLYYLAHTWSALESCQVTSIPLSSIVKTLMAVIEKESSTIPDLYHAVNALVSFGKKFSEATSKRIAAILDASLKKDDSPLNLGYIFHIAAHLGPAGSFTFRYTEDAIVQADEVDGKVLQFEGGLTVTSHLVNGVYKLSTALKKKPTLTSQQVVKLANYFLSRKTVQSSKGVYHLISSIDALNSGPEKPVSIVLAGDGVVVSAKQPFVNVKVCDLIGNHVPTVTGVVANTATKVGHDVAVLNKESLKPTPNDRTLYTLNFMSISPEPGFYKIAVSAGSVSNTITVKALADVTVDHLEIGTADADQTTQPKLIKVAYLQKLKSKIEADSLQKLVVRFLLKDSARNKPMKVHQAFVRLSSVSSTGKDQQEIIFVAEPDPSHIYKFDMSVASAAKNFNHKSGEYNVELIVGDAVLSNSFQWTVATVTLKFPEPATSDAVHKSTYRQKPNVYLPKPEIKHMFREPEKRPPPFVSNLFTGLSFFPVLILLILWYKLGVNISNFPFTLSAFIFHLSLGSIFILFGVFWLKLNMFTTLRYLLGLGLITFLSGNKLLSQIAKNRKASR